MNIIHILGITVLFSTSYSAIEDKNKQRTLLRKLQSYQPKESKPMWNEVLADVLVNKIRIFSFKTQDEQTESIKEETTQDKSALTNFISQVFFVYKKFVYDIFVAPSTTVTNNSSIAAPIPEIEERNTEDVLEETGVTYTAGPKSEVELVEPRYHGKQVLGNGTEGIVDGDSGEGESEQGCPEGTVKVKGSCESSSKLMMAIPRQCPIGYKRDRLGYCRIMF